VLSNWSDNIFMSMGERIRNEREKIGLQRKELAEKMGVSDTTQGNYEKNRKAPDAKYLEQMAELGADVQYIITGNPTLRPEDATLLDDWLKLNDADRRAFAQAVRAFAQSKEIDKDVENK